MNVPANLTYERIRQAVRNWPPNVRLTLARDILEDVATEIPRTESASEQEKLPHEETLSHALGLLASPSREAPSDVQVAAWLDEHRDHKYTQ